MTLEELGYSVDHENYRTETIPEGFQIGRVAAEHKERYIVKTETGDFEAEITGNLRYAASSREDFPAVGDWVALIPYDDENAIIHSIMPRFSSLSRPSVGKFGEKQLIASNIDVAFIVQATDRDFNINRIERYLTICNGSGISSIIILTKTDLITEQALQDMTEAINQRIRKVPVISISNETLAGYKAMRQVIEKGRTYCLLGSSGVGKSTLINNLTGKALMETSAISQSTHKGRHTTSHRELTVLPDGGIIIDNPGMREIGIADTSDGLESTFNSITELAGQCRFKDCTHTNETACAVLEAIDQGNIDAQAYENFLKIEREKAHFNLTETEKRKKDKAFGKMVKNVKNDMQKLSSKHKDVYRK